MHFVIFFMTLNEPVLILLFWVRYSKYFFPRKHFHSPNHKSVIKLKLLSTSLSTHIKLSTSPRLWDKGNLITFFAKLLLSTLHHSIWYRTQKVKQGKTLYKHTTGEVLSEKVLCINPVKLPIPLKVFMKLHERV